MRHQIAAFSVLLLLLWGANHSFAVERKVKHFDTSIAADATFEVVSAVLQLQESNIDEIVFEKGTYHFYPDKAYGTYRYISNHDDQLTATPFPLINVKKLTIDGQGSTFIFHGVMIPFLVDGSEDIVIKNLSVDWATPFHSEGLVVANNPAENTYDMKISEQYPYEIRNGELVFLKEYYEHTVGQSFLFDPETRKAAYNAQKYSAWFTIRRPVSEKVGTVKYKYPFTDDAYNPKFNEVGTELKSVFKQLSPGLVRVFNHSRALPPVGKTMVMKGDKGANRTSPAFHVTNTKNFEAAYVNVLHAGGMGIISENCTDVTLNNFNVLPSAGRLVSATADATHFIGCKGRLQLLNCNLTNQLDDGINVHGAYQEVVDVINNKTLGIRTGHFQQRGFKLGVPGDTIGIVKENGTLFPHKKLTLRSLKMLNGAYMVITFNEELPSDIKPGYLLENLSGYPEVLIENSRFDGNRARGILLSSSKKTIIRNNYFHTDMAAIQLPAESGHWYESGQAGNVLIENNTFQDCTYGGGKAAVITFTAEEGNKELTYKNIAIINNKFNGYENLVLSADKVQNLRFENNSITKTNTFPQLYPSNPIFKITHSKEVKFKNNQLPPQTKNIIEVSEDMPPLKVK